MNRKRLPLVFVALLTLLGISNVSPGASERPPNIVFLFADDLGYGDLGCYGHPYAKTPALDQLASEGTRFTQFYVTGVTCNPSRTGLMTGLFPARFPKYAADFGFGDRVTITDLLKKHGYRTGHFGKWHIGPDDSNGTYGIDTVQTIGKSREDSAGRDDDVYSAAIGFIRENKDRPFYVNVWGHATHFPVNPAPNLAAKFADVKVDRKKFSSTMQPKFDECLQIGGNLDESMRQYLGDVHQIDLNVGRVLKVIDELGLRENTIVVFSSDHGPAPIILESKGVREFSKNMLGSPGPFRGGKHTQFEGGTRVPFIIRWPGHVKAGRVDRENVCSFIDWMPTLCQLAGIKELPKQLDGEDVSDIWLGANRPRQRPLFWRASSGGATPVIREGKWKLFLHGKQECDLYDLSVDPSESNNVAEQHPEVVTQLRKKLTAWVAELPKDYEKAKSKTPNQKKAKKAGRPARKERKPKSTTRPKAENSRETKANIVLFLIDDWAWNGTPIRMDDNMRNSSMPVVQMPHIEQLAREGMKFRNAYASPQCSPSRVCIQTGQSSPRNGFTVYMNSREQDYYDQSRQYRHFPVVPCISDMSLDDDAVTIAEALKPLGYVSAHIGKWHMRGDPGDEGYALHDGDTNNNPGNTLRTGLKEGEQKPKRLPKDLADPKLMFSVTDKAIGFMDQQVKAGNPFYLQISHYAMHAGPECLPATREKYARHPLVQEWYRRNNKHADTVPIGSDPAVWFGMAEDLDGRIGALLDKIKQLGIEDNTYVVLMADNGYRHSELQVEPALTQPFHGHKWWVWQGGIRVPMIVKGPGIQAGSKFEGNVVNYDLLPTFVDWAGGDVANLKDIDGVSLAGYLAGVKPETEFLNRNLYFHYPHYRNSMPHSAVVSGQTKLLHFYERPDIPMLFDLTGDEGEVHNIARSRAEDHKRLYSELMQYLESVNARIPKKNPDYDPATYKAANEYGKRMQWGPFEEKRPLEPDEIPQP